MFGLLKQLFADIIMCRLIVITFFFTSLCVSIFAQQIGQAADPIITASIGSFRGKRMGTSSGRPFIAFLGIPYATPPIGPLRFKVRFYLSFSFYFASIVTMFIVNIFRFTIFNCQSKTFLFNK